MDSIFQVLNYNLDLRLVTHARSVPSLKVNNMDLLRLVPTFQGRPDSFLTKVEERMNAGFGYKERYLIKMPNEPVTDALLSSESLAHQAAAEAMKAGNFHPQILIHGTTSGSRYTGSQATAVAGRLGLHIPAYEMKAGCSTGLAAFHMMGSFLQTGYESALMVFAETLSKMTDPQNPETWFGLADGGVALGFQKSPQPNLRIQKSVYSTDGEFIDLYSTHGHLPPTVSGVEAGGFVLRGDPEALRVQALRRYSGMIKALMTNEEKSKVRWIMCHQVNRQLIQDVIQQNQLQGEPFWINHEYGNMGGTTIPFSLSLAVERKLFQKGDQILLLSVGGGISAAAQLWEWLG